MSGVCLFFSNLSIWVSIVASIGIIIYTIVRSVQYKDVADIDDTCKYLKYCRTASLIFMISSWLLVSEGSTQANTEVYKSISSSCMTIGIFCIISAFVNIAANIFLSMRKDKQETSTNLKKVRNPALVYGIVYLMLSFLLNVV